MSGMQQQTTTRLRKTKLCGHFFRTSQCYYGGRCSFAHSLDEVNPKSPGLTEAGFNFYDGIHRPFDRKDVANTLKWAHWDRCRGHSVPQWVYDMSWDFFVMPWLRGQQPGGEDEEGQEEEDEETNFKVKKEEGEDEEGEAWQGDLGDGSEMFEDDEEEEDEIPDPEDEEPHPPTHPPSPPPPKSMPLSKRPPAYSPLNAEQKRCKLTPKSACPQSSNSAASSSTSQGPWRQRH